MLTYFESLNVIQQVLIATGFTWAVTALGAAGVFFTKKVNRKVLDGMLGFAAGVMIAASFWSLLAPAIEMSSHLGRFAVMPALIGFLGGGLFLWMADKLMPHIHPGFRMDQAEGVKTKLQRSVLLVLAITLHNIPEGLAIGVAFGAVAAGYPSATLAGAIALAIGIGIQNFPEGFAVSVPLRREGLSRSKSFFYGQLSALVEPIAGVVGVVAVTYTKPALPYALAFAAGAMIYVAVEELIPESQRNDNRDLATMSAMVGFAIMMTLDVSMG